MPSAPPRVCARCRQPTAARKPCPCRPAFEGSRNRGTSDRRWRKTRDTYMTFHPMCERDGCRRIAEECDHIVPLAEGGERYDWRNLAALCRPHHTEKTTADALRGKTRAR